MNFDDLKKQMEELENTVNNIEKEKKSEGADPRFFKPTPDNLGNISCIIRFLPQKDFSKAPYVETAHHFVKILGKFLATQCAGYGHCLVCEETQPLWTKYNAFKDANGKNCKGCKDTLDEINNWKRKVSRITNIIVVQNPNAPETEGKVFLYNMPKTVYTKYDAKVWPKDEMDERVIVFNPIEGRNFKLSAKNKKITDTLTIPDYDESYFYDKSTPIAADAENVMRILGETYDLQEYLAETPVDAFEINERLAKFKRELSGGPSVPNDMLTHNSQNNSQNNSSVGGTFEGTPQSVDDIDAFFKNM